MNGFKILYYDVKKVSVMIKDNNLTWKSIQSYQEHPRIFQKSIVSQRFTYSEVQFIRLTIRSAKKVGFFFIIQLVPIIGYLPIAIALLFPKYILTEHFWTNEQKQLFFKQDWEMRHKHSFNLLQLWPKCDSFPTHSLSSSIIDENHYLQLLLQTNGYFMNTPSWLVSVLPVSYKISLLNQRVYEIINDDYLLRKEPIKEVDISKYKLWKALITRGFPMKTAYTSYAWLDHNWLKNQRIQEIEEKIVNDNDDVSGGSPSPLDFEVSNSSSKPLSSKEQLLLQIAWNAL
jgi:hypothetical protein